MSRHRKKGNFKRYVDPVIQIFSTTCVFIASRARASLILLTCVNNRYFEKWRDFEEKVRRQWKVSQIVCIEPNYSQKIQLGP